MTPQCVCPQEPLFLHFMIPWFLEQRAKEAEIFCAAMKGAWIPFTWGPSLVHSNGSQKVLVWSGFPSPSCTGRVPAEMGGLGLGNDTASLDILHL